MISLLDKCVLIICIINWQLLPEIDSNWGSNERSRQRCIVEKEMKKKKYYYKEINRYSRYKYSFHENRLRAPVVAQ